MLARHNSNLCDSIDVYTERRGWVVKATDSFSGGPSFKSRPCDRLSSKSLWFSPYFQANSGISTLKQATTASFQILSNSSFTYHRFIRLYVVWVTEKASLNELQIPVFRAHVYITFPSTPGCFNWSVPMRVSNRNVYVPMFSPCMLHAPPTFYLYIQCPVNHVTHSVSTQQGGCSVHTLYF
jgi:hypothetical protein